MWRRAPHTERAQKHLTLVNKGLQTWWSRVRHKSCREIISNLTALMKIWLFSRNNQKREKYSPWSPSYCWFSPQVKEKLTLLWEVTFLKANSQRRKNVVISWNTNNNSDFNMMINVTERSRFESGGLWWSTCALVHLPAVIYWVYKPPLMHSFTNNSYLSHTSEKNCKYFHNKS